MSETDALILALRDMWTNLDPAPADLADRVLFTLGMADLEFELMHLQSTLDPVGARGHETAHTMTFSSDSLTVMISLSPGQEPRRIDGWIVPAAPLRVELRVGRGSQTTMADADGRFAFPDIPAGQIQLLFHPTGETATVLNRTFVTPAIEL